MIFDIAIIHQIQLHITSFGHDLPHSAQTAFSNIQSNCSLDHLVGPFGSVIVEYLAVRIIDIYKANFDFLARYVLLTGMVETTGDSFW